VFLFLFQFRPDTEENTTGDRTGQSDNQTGRVRRRWRTASGKLNEQLFINLTDTQCTRSYLDAIPDIRSDCEQFEFLHRTAVECQDVQGCRMLLQMQLQMQCVCVAINHLWCACRRRDSSSRQDSQDSKDSQDTPLHWFPWRTGNLATGQTGLLSFTGLSGWAALIQQPGLRIIRQLINCLDKLPLIGQLSTESSDFCHIPLEEINKVLIKCQLSALKSLIKTKPVF